ncbi:hypothetical protein GOP47_0002053 [Adiantum capillus-veneris]|uniref:Uncharacterized protein n=1 Tax=Adiantum capillus-veneris TaxID=13818 RepID=A0A9D4VA75_ADICA|nr:hypothetical protein GOP47_0002053 [Adiantum capillus-veneris]
MVEAMQVTLRCANEIEMTVTSSYITLLPLLIKDLHLLLRSLIRRRPLRFTASVSTAFAIRSSQAVCCVGLDGCEYFSPSEAALKAAQGNQNGSFFEKLKRFVVPFQQDKSKQSETPNGISEVQKHSEGNSNEDQMHWFTEKPGEIISVTNGVHKVYSNPPNKMRITDEVRV